MSIEIIGMVGTRDVSQSSGSAGASGGYGARVAAGMSAVVPTVRL